MGIPLHTQYTNEPNAEVAKDFILMLFHIFIVFIVDPFCKRAHRCARVSEGAFVDMEGTKYFCIDDIWILIIGYLRIPCIRKQYYRHFNIVGSLLIIFPIEMMLDLSFI